MKAEIIKKGRTWIVGAALLAGLVYSSVALGTDAAFAAMNI